MTTSRIALALAVCLGVAGAGCSSISDSISSPFESSSASSRSLEGREAKFHRDVRDYTATFVRSNGNMSVFTNGIADLAAQRGITNWQSDMATYTAIGEGMKDAKADRGTLEAYIANIAPADANKAAAIRKGYGD
jgi:hypothetical protein